MLRLENADPELYALIERQRDYERTTLKLIASENFASEAVMEATGSILTNKYSEGYPGARYYEGNEVVDEVEDLARTRLKRIFGAEHANVQPYSGSPANSAVYRALLKPGDKVMGLPVSEGGHLTHGWPVNFSGMDYVSSPYSVDIQTGRVNYDELRTLALRERPRLIWVGGTAYPRAWDFEAAASIAREVDAYLVADIAHISGLVAAGVHPNPTHVADAVSSTSHKTLRGPRGGFILSKITDRYQSRYHPETKRNMAQRIDRAVFPTLQGGPHMNAIAGLAAALKEAETDTFKDYATRVIANARALGDALKECGYDLVSGGTDTHLLLLDLRGAAYSGKDASRALARAGMIANFNMVPGDPRKPAVTSGVRLGSAAVTTRGMGEAEMRVIASLMHRAMSSIDDDDVLSTIRKEVAGLCEGFLAPGYG
jgi:glycine hydroxymethyltransferase